MIRQKFSLAKVFAIVCGLGGGVLVESGDAAVAGSAVPPNCKLYQQGIASWYGEDLRGTMMKNNKRFNPDLNTVAHKSLPMDTKVAIVTQMRGEYGRVAMAVVTDRGPYKGGRIEDVSKAIAHELGFYEKGLQQVSLFICPE